MSYCLNLPHLSSIVGTWLYNWQTLLAGALAFVGALLTVRHIRKQVSQSEDHWKEEIARRHNAARLTLPLALAAVHEMIQGAADQIADELEQHGPDAFDKTFNAVVDGKGFREHFSRLRLGEDTTRSFREFVAALSDRNDIRHVAELVASLQIFIARFNDFDLQGAGRQLGLESLLLDAAKLRLLNDKIYNYARFVDDSHFGIVGTLEDAAAWEQIKGKAQGLVFMRQSPDFFFPAINKLVDGYKEGDTTPWNEKFVG